MSTSRRAIRFAAMFMMVILIACNLLPATPIGKIQKDPRSYESISVTISGTVTARGSLVLIKYFTVADKSGSINVITQRILPPVGSKVRIKGRVKEAFAIGDEQMLVFIEDTAEQG
jgi:hypothetical protein